MGNKNVMWADEMDLAKDLNGKVYIVTGANSGVGLETTRQLVKQGAHVVMACRRTDAGEGEAKSFSDLPGSYEVMKLDLANLQSVRTFAEAFLATHNRLDALVGNAGFVNMKSEVQHTVDGLESTIGVSYFGHFLLTELLLDILKKSAPSRIVLLSSVMHAGSAKNRVNVNLDDINYNSRPFKSFGAYAEAKVAVNLYAMELAERLQGTGVTTASVHPGWARSNFGKGGGVFMSILMTLAKPLTYSISNSSEESAQTSLHCLLSDDAPNHSGAYFSQHSVLYSDKECRKGGWPMTSPNPNARDMDRAKKLVDLSYGLVGLR